MSKETDELLELLDAVPTINSGATFADNDAIIPVKNFTKYRYRGISVEAKVTSNKSFSLKKDIFEKTEKESFDKMPIMAIEIDGLQLVVMRLDDFVVMKDELNEA